MLSTTIYLLLVLLITQVLLKIKDIGINIQQYTVIFIQNINYRDFNNLNKIFLKKIQKRRNAPVQF